MSKKFQKKIENFDCLNCGSRVVGNGYTNHCPTCLYSRHVDINPGDRAAECGGLMAPISLEQKKGSYVITHQCQKCGFERKNKLNEADSMETVFALARKLSERSSRRRKK